MATARAHNPAQRRHIGIGASVPFNVIYEPGTYVCNWSGHLLRVPGEGLPSGRQPPLNIVGPEPLFVTKISENPYVDVRSARRLARRLALGVNF